MRIIEIELLTDNLVETEKFYANILGLELIKKGQNIVSFKAGDTTLIFKESDNLAPKYHYAFNVPHNKLDEILHWSKSRFSLLKNSEGELISHFESWNAKSVYFYDNNQNILEFIARFDLDNPSDTPFDSSSIISVSEAGFVVDSPKSVARELIENHNLSYFTKGTQSPDFMKLGDDNGLIIIAETNRKWYPTDFKAEKHYLRVRVDAGDSMEEIIVNES